MDYGSPMRKMVTASILVALMGCSSAASSGSSSSQKTLPRTEPSEQPTAASEAPIVTVEVTASEPTEPPTTSTAETEPPTTTEEVATTVATNDGTHAHPFTIAEFRAIGDYDPITVGALELVDPATLEAANPYNSIPPDGSAYVRVSVSGTYAGADKGSGYTLGFLLSLVGDQSTLYRPAYPASITDDLSAAKEVITGGVISGYMYFLVPTSDANFLLAADDIIHDTVYVDVTP